MPDETQVEVYSPKGQYGLIPSNQIQQALAQGYKPKDAYVEAIDPKSGKTGIIPKEQWSAAQAQGYTMSPVEQSRQQMQSTPMQQMPTTMQQVFKPSAGPNPAARGGYFLPSYNSAEEAQGGAKQASIGLATMGAGSLGRAAQLGLMGRAAMTGAGAATGSLAGDVAGGQPPDVKGAAETGLLGTGAELVAGGATAAFKGASRQISKLFGESPERIAELKALPQAEEAIRQRVVQAEETSRTAFKAAYPAIDEAQVNVAATKNIAQQASKELGAVTSVPRPIAKVAGIPEPAQNVLTSDDPNIILKELAEHDNIPFRQAQQYRSAIEQYISKNKPIGNSYNLLKQVSGSLTDGLKMTADREGVLKQFLQAEGMFKQHAADFWNKSAPLKSFLQTPPNATGATLNKFMQVVNQGRALTALEQRGVPTQDLKAILAKTPKALKVDIRDAATLKNLGQGTLDNQVASANRSTVKKWAAGAIGAGSLYELLQHLSKGRQQSRP